MDYSPWNSPGQNTGVGTLSLLQGIFPTQGFNPGLPHCRQILYQLSHKGSPRILEWIAFPFYSPWNSPGQNTGVGSLSLLWSIFPTQGPNPGLPHCRQILYQPSHKGRQAVILDPSRNVFPPSSFPCFFLWPNLCHSQYLGSLETAVCCF